MELFDLLLGISFQVINGRLENIDVDDVVFDSRKSCKNSIFVCISGQNYDSHKDAQFVYDKGAKLLVVEKNVKVSGDVVVIKVKSTRKALSFLCINLFKKPHKNLNLIGVTGTKGKTSTAVMLKTMLDATGHKCGLIGSLGVIYNDKCIQTINTTPDPYSLQKILKDMADDGIDTVILEVSAIALKQDRVVGMKFKLGILTNIMIDYLDYREFTDAMDYIDAKAKLFSQCECSIINGDDKYKDKFMNNALSKIFTYGLTADVDLRANNINLINDGKNLGLSYEIYDLRRTFVELHQIGRQNVYNSLAALYAMQILGYDLDKFTGLLKDVKVKGRAEVVENTGGRNIIIDCAVRPAGFSSIFESLSEYKENLLISVFSVDDRSDQNERMELVKIICKYSNVCVLVTDANNELGREIEKYIIQSNLECKVFNTRNEAVEYAVNYSDVGDIILLLGTGRYDKSIFNGDYDMVREVLKDKYVS